MNWKNKKVLVTGAGGFIGSHLTEALLARGARVEALIHYNSRNHWGHLEGYSRRCPKGLMVTAGDVRDAAFMRQLVKGHDTVFHLAALIPIPYSYVAPQSFVDTNVTGTLNVLEACRREGVRRVVHTSTSETYGTARYVPMDEAHPLQGQSPYSATKIAADKLAESYFRSFELPVVTVRPFNCFGPRQSARAVIPTVLCSLVEGRRELSLGDVRPVRDFTFVEDTARGFILAAEKAPAGETVNIGRGAGVSVLEIVRLAARAAGVAMPEIRTDRRRVRPAKSEVGRLVCDNRRARRLLGWSPKISLADGLKRTAEYIRANIGEYKTHIYNI